MKKYLFIFLLLIAGMVSEIYAQACPGIAYGNTTGSNGRFFIMTYDSEAERDAALDLISSISINGGTYNVGPHPSGNMSIRTVPVQSAGTFPVSFTGTITLNSTGVSCDYSASTLPVTLVEFKATLEKSAVVIKWETAQEINNEGFEIQKSTDGINFETFTWVNGVGSSTQAQYYEVKDTEYSNGFNYYRLKQIDYDGAFELSSIIAVNSVTNNLVELEKNILTRGQNVILLSASNEGYEIFDATGSKVGSGFIEGQYHPLSTVGFNAGMYFIKLERGNILKFIIK